MILNSRQSIDGNPCPSWDCRAQLYVPWCHPRLPKIQIHHLRQSPISLIKLRWLQIQISKLDHPMSVQLQLRSKQLFEILVIWELRWSCDWKGRCCGTCFQWVVWTWELIVNMCYFWGCLLTCLGLFAAWRLITAKNSVSINQKDVRSERSRKMYTPQTCQLHW